MNAAPRDDTDGQGFRRACDFNTPRGVWGPGALVCERWAAGSRVLTSGVRCTSMGVYVGQ